MVWGRKEDSLRRLERFAAARRRAQRLLLAARQPRRKRKAPGEPVDAEGPKFQAFGALRASTGRKGPGLRREKDLKKDGACFVVDLPPQL